MKGRPVAGAFYPEPSQRVRLLGMAGILGALLWPVSLVVLANIAGSCPETACEADRGSIGVAALAPVLIGLTALGLELRARHTPGLGDLVGGLTIATAATLFLLSFVTGAIGFVGPGLLLLLIGSSIFGMMGYLSGARQRVASAVLAIGSGFMVVFLFSGALGSEGLGGETPAILALLLFSTGWGWLGAHLLAARPLPIPPQGGRSN